MSAKPRHRSELAWPLLLAACHACGGVKQPAGVSAGATQVAGRSDGGSADGSVSTRSARLDGGPILPPADEAVVLPLGGPPIKRRISIAADPGVLDVHFSVDTTASIDAEINQLQAALESTIVPQLRMRVADVSFGVSKFADFPAPPFGSPGDTATGDPADTPFVLLTPITSDISAVASAVARLDQPLGEGGDIPEAGAEALWQIATGKGYSLSSKTLIAPYDGRAALGGGTAGGVGFRAGALRVVLHVTDAPSHAPEDYGSAFPGTHSLDEAGQALFDLGAKLIGIVSGACDPAAPKTCSDTSHAAARADLEGVALKTEALGADPVDDKCPMGVGGALLPSAAGKCPLVFDVDAEGNGLSAKLVDAIVGLVDGTRFRAVTGAVSDDPIGFVESVTPVAVAQTSSADAPTIADLLPADAPDGKPDSFVQVRSRAKLAFDVTLRNLHIAASDTDQSFRVVVQVTGDGLILAERTLRVIVPAGDALVPLTDLDAGL
ncbi:MAG: hypothetical protein ACHQ53_08400 [Polyangiales bacterium]